MKFYNNQIKKKTIHLVLSLALSTSMIATGCASQAATSTTTTISVGENQRLIQGQIMSIAGNEISLALIDDSQQVANTTETDAAISDQDTTASSQFSRPGPGSATGDASRPSRPEGETRGADGTDHQQPPDAQAGATTEQPEDAQAGATAEQPSDASSPLPSDRSADGQANSAPDPSSSISSGSTDSSSAVGGSTVETLQLTIPVGTNIITAQGKTTTFSRLAAGDTIQVLLESTSSGEVVVGVWMLDVTATETENSNDGTTTNN